MVVVGYGRGQFLAIASPYTPPLIILWSSSLVLYRSNAKVTL